ncbi:MULTISPECIES: hypothetical protein [unclassified Flavobacterium]|uniref:hypothetical protein n=1 Tax=unclassified Flavobacterium TaxID=196869 RepID=UPI000EAF403A|nr:MULTISPECIES: hypothetical protein [unclassified Flavobacterium]RKS03544.1 hypothetical protein C8C84_3304 [Flavobacterium sp. 102]
MKKSTLSNFSIKKDYVFIENENGFRMDFSRDTNSSALQSSISVDSSKKKGLATILLLFFVFLFTNFLFAQPPACNLNGPLKYELGDTSSRANRLLQFKSDVSNAKPNTVYLWSFKTNNTEAIFASENGLDKISVNAGKLVGTFTIELKVTNPSADGSRESCTCTQSVTVVRNNKDLNTK